MGAPQGEGVEPQSFEHAAADEDRRYQTFWRRVGAMFLDGAVLAPVAWFDQLIWNHTTQPFVLLPWALFDSSIGLVYEIAFVAAYGQTLGKMACGVRIYDQGGKAVSLTQAMLRQIVPMLLVPFFAVLQAQNILSGQLANRALGSDFWSFRTFLLLMFGWLMLEVVTMLTNRRRRAIHDFIAGTVVVRASGHTSLRWWLVGLLVLSFVVPNFLPERNITSAPQFQPAQ